MLRTSRASSSAAAPPGSSTPPCTCVRAPAPASTHQHSDVHTYQRPHRPTPPGGASRLAEQAAEPEPKPTPDLRLSLSLGLSLSLSLRPSLSPRLSLAPTPTCRQARRAGGGVWQPDRAPSVRQLEHGWDAVAARAARDQRLPAHPRALPHPEEVRRRHSDGGRRHEP